MELQRLAAFLCLLWGPAPLLASRSALSSDLVIHASTLIVDKLLLCAFGCVDRLVCDPCFYDGVLRRHTL